MRFRTSLHYRVALAFALLGALVSTMLGATLFFAIEDLEQRLIDQALNAELEDYASRRERNPHSPPPSTSLVKGFVEPSVHYASGIPPAIHNAAPGQYSLELDGHHYRALVAERGGRRFYLLHDLSQTEGRNKAILALIAGGVVFAILMSMALGYGFARRVIRPVSQLAAHVGNARPDVAAPPLAPRFPEDELGRLADAFDRYQRRIQGFVERERAFTADLSHELRTPLTVIRGATDLLLADPLLAEPLRQRVGRIHRAAEEMSELTPALLALARETPEGTGRTDAVREVRRLVENHSGLLQGKPINVELDLPDELSVPADPALLRVVLGNLIKNAFSYTDSGCIQVRLDKSGFTLSDTGQGIDDELFAQLFQGYVSGAKGYGIGLSLVKRICDRYDWVIAINSMPGEGTTIRLRFNT